MADVRRTQYIWTKAYRGLGAEKEWQALFGLKTSSKNLECNKDY
jgi:hypothetical protein